MGLNEEEQLFVRRAARFLERPSFLIRTANRIGKPVEIAIGALPAKGQKLIHAVSQEALKKGLLVVMKTLPNEAIRKAVPSFSDSVAKTRRVGRWHSAVSFGAGAAGGFFGWISLPLELPITTGIMLRSIATIASEFGMELSETEVKLECLYILSLGSPRTKDDEALASAYWTSRTAFSRLAGEAAGFLAGVTAADLARDMEKKAAPVLFRLLAAIAARFEVVVSEKVMAETLPVIGALGGGFINAAFTDYFSDAARFHFGLRALEARHGRAAVEQYYGTQGRKS